jgi:uncharacterized HAD superfamily protein
MLTKEEILKNKIDNHKWGYSYSNIASTDGTMNDFLNIALEAMSEYANQDKWISAKELSNANEVGKKVLLFRKMNDSQREMAITVYDTFLVKHCDPETTFWQKLPNPPKP